jgi:hypothetical protein
MRCDEAAAQGKLKCRAAASKHGNELSGGSLRRMVIREF